MCICVNKYLYTQDGIYGDKRSQYYVLYRCRHIYINLFTHTHRVHCITQYVCKQRARFLHKYTYMKTIAQIFEARMQIYISRDRYKCRQ